MRLIVDHLCARAIGMTIGILKARRAGTTYAHKEVDKNLDRLASVALGDGEVRTSAGDGYDA
jgi:hypothetical protein